MSPNYYREITCELSDSCTAGLLSTSAEYTYLPGFNLCSSGPQFYRTNLSRRALNFRVCHVNSQNSERMGLPYTPAVSKDT